MLFFQELFLLKKKKKIAGIFFRERHVVDYFEGIYFQEIDKNLQDLRKVIPNLCRCNKTEISSTRFLKLTKKITDFG